MYLNDILNDYIKIITENNNNIDSIVLSGSRSSLINDDMSDYDIYVYSKGLLNSSEDIELRRKFAEKHASYYEIGNDYFEHGDEMILKDSGICLDFMYRDLSWAEGELEYVWRGCNAKIGYTTAFLYNIKHSNILYDKGGKFKKFQGELNEEYPKKLKNNIIEKNFNVMYGKKIASFYEQLEKAVKRNDIVSINHRITAILSSYFDILFALNEELHVGEKKLLDYVFKLCRKIPNNFDRDIKNILFCNKNDENVLERIKILIENIEKIF
ncbi:DUF4037 domain-containing protein [Brachyspira hampsonii]|uniref:DUF4037 domain-containing protein n=2 Tax=Brachyspira hampsonii TaxID=1287055 RepID=A0A2U4F0Q6_9SPIR|nr:DUF4037 domain-containing protein [Brachyspira hampsonii]EKV55817.1 hypothetical protein A966_13230 [Brachyspira hampsonii 30446]MBW5389595.1 DUF4037 domain-containing protein [Brachyspira hampsonii]OEJ20004.1 nucleotidyltransferase [Brachyspira hampsonii]